MKFRSALILLIVILFHAHLVAQDPTQTKHKAWYIPDYATAQFAGNIGFVSVGIGYKFFNDRLYSELLYGYVPPFISEAKQVHTITLKNTFPLFTKQYGTVSLSPIVGLTASFETGNNSFVKLPDKYPKGYYYPNAFHFTFFIGGKLHRDFSTNKVIKGADLFVELGTVETYLWYAIKTRQVSLTDVFSTAIGLNFYF